MRSGCARYKTKLLYQTLRARKTAHDKPANTYSVSLVLHLTARHTLCTDTRFPGRSPHLNAPNTAAKHPNFGDVHPVSLRRGRYSGRPWSEQEDARLREAVSQHGRDWAQAAAHVGNGRTNRGCRQRWLLRLQTSVSKGPFTMAEMSRLRDLLRAHPKQWTKVAQLLGSGHSGDQVRDFAVSGSGMAEHYRVWTAEEDQALRDAVAKHGVGKWAAVADLLERRDDASCYSRWTFSLDPKLVRGAWSEDEDRRLVAAVQALEKSGEPFHFGDVAVLMQNRRHRKACRSRYKRLIAKAQASK
ncbi:unnamed protein product [Chondrus crispus]|uniref:Uncharacterized protein n=1 Tax=Chondrus crispus TaxID=2769 RepID=R7QL64_CHOCR|nr:unnamed protein product [Chondrus crispus]CDF38231.1 unnamed protein product [Chondrus crispus]|eukprot:XP_005718116.1 unnamed protein product [Chondrus crispus]